MSELGAEAAPVRRDEGRRVVLEPTPPGTWPLLLGVALAALAPMMGFLVGTAIGVGDDAEAKFGPMYVALFIGFVVGGVGVLVALTGGLRLWRHIHRQDIEQEAGVPPERASTAPR